MIEVVIGQKGRILKQLNSNLLLNVLDKQILDFVKLLLYVGRTPSWSKTVHKYPVSQKGHSTLVHNFVKYWPILKIRSPADSAVIA